MLERNSHCRSVDLASRTMKRTAVQKTTAHKMAALWTACITIDILCVTAPYLWLMVQSYKFNLKA